ncbi:hypothetical protein MMC07_006049 [Pseudocyphellaria aurata]|nr:hypothetical protein [Pseudocyphellaria aurata]
MAHVPRLKNMKRKREDSRNLNSPGENHGDAKRRAEQMVHGRPPMQRGNGLCAAYNNQRESQYTWIDESAVIPAGNVEVMDWENTHKSEVYEVDPPTESPKQSSSHAKHEQSIRAIDQQERVCPDATSKATLRQMIESQFSLEILLKHQELRLIDQELAKSQIALEQLRRCQIVPYPAMSSNLEEMRAVGSGSGLTLETRVPHPPPWGISDGPYTRHYERWLIPDSAFDVNAAEPSRPPQTAGKAVPERSARGSVSEKNVFTGNSRSQRGSNNARLQALPHGYPEPKEDKGPMILKRSTDGQMVKLVCLDCRRDNFNSAQGFINHCRIAHNRGFASHDAAAIACGEEVDVNPNGSVTGDLSLTTSASVGLVHPLIRSAHAVRSTPTHLTFSSSSSRRKKSTSSTQTMDSIPTQPSGPSRALSTPKIDCNGAEFEDNTPVPFTPSPQTPHLSAFFARLGHDLDLNEMVNDAKTRPDTENDLDVSSDEDDEDMDDVPEPQLEAHNLSSRGVIRGGRLPARAAMSPAPLERVPSNKRNRGSRRPEFLPPIAPRAMYNSPYSASALDPPTSHSLHNESVLIDTSPTLNLSPNTIESHPAPSLVSDDGDYENTHSESETPSSAEDGEDEDRYLDIEVEDHDQIDALEGSTSAATDHLGLAGSVKPHSPAARRSSALRSPTAIRPGTATERHVSFASTERRPRGEGQKGSRRRVEK